VNEPPPDRPSSAGEVTHSDPEAGLLRWARRLALGGFGLGVTGAVIVGVLGVPGGVGVLVVVLGSAFGLSLAAVLLLVSALIDELRGRPVSRRRPLRGLGAFVAAIVLLIALVGMDP